MSDLKFIEGPLNSEQLQSLMICAKLGHSTTPAVLVALLDQLDAQRLRADTAEAALAQLRERHNTVKCQRNDATKGLAAAEQRIADLSSLLSKILGAVDGEPIDFNLIMKLRKEMRAALNPNPEAESHE